MEDFIKKLQGLLTVVVMIQQLEETKPEPDVNRNKHESKGRNQKHKENKMNQHRNKTEKWPNIIIFYL